MAFLYGKKPTPDVPKPEVSLHQLSHDMAQQQGSLGAPFAFSPGVSDRALGEGVKDPRKNEELSLRLRAARIEAQLAIAGKRLQKQSLQEQEDAATWAALGPGAIAERPLFALWDQARRTLVDIGRLAPAQAEAIEAIQPKLWELYLKAFTPTGSRRTVELEGLELRRQFVVKVEQPHKASTGTAMDFDAKTNVHNAIDDLVRRVQTYLANP
jgi:hypothetical protein